MKLGLVLGSGAARGWAHIGVLQVLRERGIKPSCVVGTSMGALVGGVYLSNQLDALQQVAVSLDSRAVFQYFVEFSIPRSGLVDGVKIKKILRDLIGTKKLEDLPLTFCTVAADLQTGEQKIIRRGDIVDAIRASIAIPGIFTPIIKGDCTMVDGGLVNPLPVNVARQMGADYVLAVDVNGKPDKLPLASRKSSIKLPKWFPKNQGPTIFDVLGNAARIVERELTAVRLLVDKPDLLIQPEVGHYNFMEFHRAREIIEEGRRAARAALKDWKL